MNGFTTLALALTHLDIPKTQNINLYIKRVKKIWTKISISNVPQSLRLYRFLPFSRWGLCLYFEKGVEGGTIESLRKASDDENDDISHVPGLHH